MQDIPFEPLAVIADVHGNADALAAVLADIDAQGIHRIANLGDHFSGPLDPAGTADLLLSRPMTAIRGNHDRVLVQDRAEMGPSDHHADARLPEAARAWLAQMPASATLPGGVVLCHGTPASDTTYWLEELHADGRMTQRDLAGVRRHAAGLDARLVLCAHTHIARRLDLPGGAVIVNPGSVGCPAYTDTQPVPHRVQTGSPAARYAVIRWRGSWDVCFHAAPYDTGRMVALARAAGRDDWAQAVATGWIG